jgi:hypothetical protein
VGVIKVVPPVLIQKLHNTGTNKNKEIKKEEKECMLNPKSLRNEPITGKPTAPRLDLEAETG